METTETEHDTLEPLKLATADSTKQCVEGERSDIEQSDIEEQSDAEQSDVEPSDAELAPQDEKTEPDVLRPAKTITSDGWGLCCILASYFWARFYEASERMLRRGVALTRAALGVMVRRVKSEIVTSNAVAGLILAAVFVTTSAMILLLEQVMPAWRAALVTSGIMAVIGFSLLQAQMITDVTRAWARAKSLRREVAVRVTELVGQARSPRRVCPNVKEVPSTE